MDVASLVKSISSCFDDAAGLVRRIRDKDTDSGNAATGELIDSLELGPVVINGYFNYDTKRFGEAYTAGDPIAVDQLKDVLIHLQMTVLTTLSTVLVLDKDLDHAAIQAASDDCRVNAGVSLGQLSQRLADPARAQQQTTHSAATFPFSLNLPPLRYSLSTSSQASDGPRTPTTPELEEAMAEFDYPGRLPGFVRPTSSQDKAMSILKGDAPGSPRRKSVRASTYSGSLAWDMRKTSLDDDTHRPHPPSSLSTEEPLHVSPVSPMSTFDQWGRPAPPSHPGPGSVESPITARKSDDVRERFGPDDYNDVTTPTYQIKPVKSRPAPITVPAGPTQRPSAQYKMPVPQITEIHPIHRRPSVTRSSTARTSVSTQPYPSMYPAMQAPASRSSASLNAPIPVASDDIVPPLPTPPLPSKSPARRANEMEPLRPGAKKILGDIHPYIDRFVNEPAMPTESNMMGYCKGAFRLQIGLEKKAFSPAQRPSGMMGLMAYWKCEKCHFEGPLRTTIGPNKRPEKVFDQSVREHEGIRFKWAFLAKCHVPMKFSAARPDGFAGSFGCIFCTAEARERGWNIAGMSSDGKGRKNSFRPSIGSSGHHHGGSAVESTPIFGNPASFMEHLQFHRQMNYWPNREMQKKMKCIVGRVAEVGEDFDVNFMPIEVEMEA